MATSDICCEVERVLIDRERSVEFLEQRQVNTAREQREFLIDL
jgi:hypothetical protein